MIGNKRTLFFFKDHFFLNEERTWKKSFLILSSIIMPLFLFFLILIHFYVIKNLSGEIHNNMHGIISLNVGYERAYCGSLSKSSESLSENTPTDAPLNTLLFKTPQEQQQYCSRSKTIIYGEPSLSYVFSGIFKIKPDITLRQLEIMFMAIKLVLVSLFFLILLKLGFSPFYISGLAILCFTFLFNVKQNRHWYSNYPFLIPLFLTLLSLCITFIRGVKKYDWKFLPFLWIIGFFSSFYVGLRTAHAPVILATLIVLFVCYYFYGCQRRPIIQKIITCFSFVAILWGGHYVFTALYMTPLFVEYQKLPKTDSFNYSHHPISHPLVLALGIEKSDLSEREGIIWKDSRGEALAQKVDPNTTFLSPTYEKALFTYYIQLWKEHFLEMIDIYCTKIKKSKTFIYFGHGPFFTAIHIFILLLSMGLLIKYRSRLNFTSMFLTSSIVLATVILYAESIVIYHKFRFNYHALVNLLYFMILLFYAQWGINYLLFRRDSLEKTL